ncbi:PQQ-binding-like beta-propeller repeat protein [Candidatus Roizmanbacteria bacterium]|nr:PQQ-binding-like beta-propeller repeat protein [Candidatus Roizmanbacteria bacterium]
MIRTKIESSILNAVVLVFFLSFIASPVSAQTSSSDWYMAGANPPRTSNSSIDVSGVTGITWYRPIEAYISASTQLITSGGNVYVATAKGLIVLDAENGNLVCRFDTELPVATPTVDGNSVYLPGFDRKLYSLNASSCAINWTFTAVGAGFSANPIVAGGRVYIGNRDGKFYALNASNGTQVWSYNTDGPIMQSAAYDPSASSGQGALYFASMDMYGYALNASNGSLIWKTAEKLPGERYSTWWPVVHGNYVVWSAANPYKPDSSPGALDAGYNRIDYDAFFVTNPTGTLNAGTTIASSDGSHGWPAGSTVMSTISSDGPNTLQGWVDSEPAHRVYAIVNKSNGVEPFYLPFIEAGQNETGQQHPPVSDGTTLYFNNVYQKGGANIPRSRIMAWKEGTPWLSMAGNITFAVDEPLILSMANGRLFANLCCDREARTIVPGNPNFWTYGQLNGQSNMLDGILPSSGEPNSYDPMWAFYDGEQFLERLGGYYKGNINSRNGVYNHHGMQNPLVPHRFTNSSSQTVQRLFTHRSNAIIALGTNSNKTPLSLITINTNPGNAADTLSTTELQARLETEVQKMVDLYLANGTNGFLRPAYISDGGRSAPATMPEDTWYFILPGDTVYTLTSAYPYLSTELKADVLSYLNAYWQKYFVTNRILRIGWNSGTPREAMQYPPEVTNRMTQIGDSTTGTTAGTWQRTFYAAWKYAQLVPSQATNIYNTIRPMLIYPPPTIDIVRNPAMYNDYIVGYQGFLYLYDLSGNNPDPTLRANVASQLTTLRNTRLTNFAKDHPWEGSVDNPTGITINNYVRRYNCTRNFLYMTPDLGNDMRTSAQSSAILTALNEYQYVCPHWFMTRDHNSFQEASVHHIFDSHALFLAKAYVAQESQANLSKWIDVPWMLGDLYYMQNLVAALEASGPGPTSTPGPTGQSTPTPTGTQVTGDVNGDGSVTIADLSILLANFGGTEKQRNQGDITGNDGLVTIADLSMLLSNFGN